MRQSRILSKSNSYQTVNMHFFYKETIVAFRSLRSHARLHQIWCHSNEYFCQLLENDFHCFPSIQNASIYLTYFMHIRYQSQLNANACALYRGALNTRQSCHCDCSSWGVSCMICGGRVAAFIKPVFIQRFNNGSKDLHPSDQRIKCI